MGLINTPLCSIICYHSEVFIKKNAVGVLSGEPINEKPGNFCIIIKNGNRCTISVLPPVQNLILVISENLPSAFTQER